MNAQILEVSPYGVGKVFSLEGDARAIVKRQGKQPMSKPPSPPFPPPLLSNFSWGLVLGTHVRLMYKVMSMAPETALDAKRFEEAPVPVGERTFLING